MIKIILITPFFLQIVRSMGWKQRQKDLCQRSLSQTIEVISRALPYDRTIGNPISGLDILTVTVLKLLARTTWTWIIWARHLVSDDWSMALWRSRRVVIARLGRRIAWLVRLLHVRAVSCEFLLLCGIFRLLRLLFFFRSFSNLDRLLSLFRLIDASTCESHCYRVVHLVDHIIPELNALKLEDKQWILLFIA